MNKNNRNGMVEKINTTSNNYWRLNKTFNEILFIVFNFIIIISYILTFLIKKK